MPEIINEKVVFDDILKIEEAQIKNGNHTYSRVRVKRQDGAAVLVHNTEAGTMVLTKQFRYPISTKITEDIFELLAGKVDEGEDPFDTAIREAKEEIGYVIAPENMTLIASCFVSPGYTSELLHLYYAEVTNKDKRHEGGGLKSEDEEIEILEMKISEFESNIDRMSFADSKTLLAGNWFLRNKKRTPSL